ncbi:MAG: DUF1573 domain-containing protein [Candidatus Kaelpia aquatica]|nr:DUF1573 domain-containing protein [Candidatus Kaelpia aquatica]
MKIILLILLSLLLPTYVYGQNAPAIEVIDSPWDFGQVKRGEISEKSFFIINSGEETLLIEGISSCCGYLIVDLSLWAIVSGEKSKITISCNSRLKNLGQDEKYFTIKSNDPANPELKAPIISYIIE